MTPQLIIEYAAEPPFRSGTPEQAAPEIVTQASEWLAPFVAAARTSSEQSPGSVEG